MTTYHFTERSVKDHVILQFTKVHLTDNLQPFASVIVLLEILNGTIDPLQMKVLLDKASWITKAGWIMTKLVSNYNFQQDFPLFKAKWHLRVTMFHQLRWIFSFYSWIHLFNDEKLFGLKIHRNRHTWFLRNTIYFKNIFVKLKPSHSTKLQKLN